MRRLSKENDVDMPSSKKTRHDELLSAYVPGILRRNSHFVFGLTASACSISRVIVSRTRPDGSPRTSSKNGLPEVQQINSYYNILRTLTKAYLVSPILAASLLQKLTFKNVILRGGNNKLKLKKDAAH